MLAELAALLLPVLVIQGDLDLSSPPHLAGRPTAAMVSGARLISYEGAPHGLPVSHPVRLNADLLAFIGGGNSPASKLEAVEIEDTLSLPDLGR